jgi:hypothetical protein
MGTRRRRSGLTVVGALLGACLVSALSSASALAAEAPAVVREYVSNVHTTAATLNAQINPGEAATSYRFEYGSGVSYGTTVPIPDGSVGAGVEAVLVSQALSGLASGATYHYRVVASNTEGTTAGPDHTLQTFASPSAAPETCPNAAVRNAQFSTYLPDCRAYEMVSPVDKEGGNITTYPGDTQSSINGDAIKYTSLAAFGDATGIETHGAEYVSQRAADGSGWSTHGINPPQSSKEFSIFVTAQYVGLSEDLSKGVYFGLTPVTAGHPNVEKVANLYLRTDLLSAPPGSYELLSDSVGGLLPRPQNDNERELEFAGASEDWSHIFFESMADLTADTQSLSPERTKLYEWNDGVVSLAGILPGGEPATESIAGDGAGGGLAYALTDNTNLEPRMHAISADGSRVIFEGGPLGHDLLASTAIGGELFMRIDGRETVQLNTPGTPATFAGANADDSKVLFIENGYLYMYDVNAPEGKHLTEISVDSEPGPGDGSESAERAFAVVGTSSDLSYIYFLGRNRLIAGQSPNPEPLGRANELYVWHNGLLRLIISRISTGKYAFSGEAGWGEFGFTRSGGYAYQHGFRATPDGRQVMFASLSRDAARRVGYDDERDGPGHEYEFSGRRGCQRVNEEGLCQQVYIYNYTSDKLACVSCNPSGAPSETNAGFEDEGNAYGAGGYTQYEPRALSDDGRYVFFDSTEPLVTQDTNGNRDVYEYDTVTHSLYLISSGTCSCGSFFVDASPDGSNVFFNTAQRMVSADSDNAVDLYDARMQGGIPSQSTPPVAPCEGDDCQGPANGAPTFSAPASSTFAGAGNGPPASLQPAAKKRSKGLTRAQRLSQALRSCQKQRKGKRVACERRARRRYGPIERSAVRASRPAGR